MRGIANRLAAAAIACAALLPGQARAWGDEGHEVVALIAWRHMTPTVRAKVTMMLGKDTDTLTKPDFASRATWADRFRDSDRNGTKLRYSLTREWHFVDIELDHPDLAAACFDHPPAAVPASAGPAKSCVVDRIESFEAELRGLPAEDPERTAAFRFLLHFVGDVHQPLHAADHEDQGGNQAMVLFGAHRVGGPLHAFWDTEVVKRLGSDPQQVAVALDRRLGSRCRGWMAGTPADWAQDSFVVARDVAYRLGAAGVDANGKPAFVLSAAYQSQAVKAAGEQLEKAGCRLAMVLNRSVR